MDPPRLRSDAGTLEARLLRSSPNFEPAPGAEEELWRRLKIATAVGVGVAAGVGTATQAASSAAPAAGKALVLTVLKWAAIAAVGVPAAGFATHTALQRWKTHAVEPAPIVAPPALPSPATRPTPMASCSPVARPDDLPTPAAHAAPAPPHPDHAIRRSETTALRAESALLANARAKLAVHDYAAALDDVARSIAQFPRGKLAQEREVVAVDALAALGDRDAARARALTFLQRFAGSPYAAHVRQSLER